MLSAREIASMRTTLDLVSNATLTAINGPGTLDGYGDPQATGPTLWTGSAPCYLERKQIPGVVDERQQPIHQDTLTILEGVAAVVEIAGPDWEASTVTVSDERTTTPVARTFRVGGMVHDHFGTLDSVTLTLTDPS